MSAPWQWITGYGYQENLAAAVWVCADTLTTPPPYDAGTYSSPFEIQPGETKVFALVSRHPPARVTFYAQGFDSLPDVETYFVEEYPGEVNSAGYPEYPSLFRVGVSGRAIGPALAMTGVLDAAPLNRGRENAPRITGRGRAHRIALPTGMRQTLEHHDPTFMIWEEAAYDTELVDWYTHSDRQVPFAVIGDFNGDGIKDVAIHGRSGSQEIIYCLLSAGDHFRVIEVEKHHLDAPTRLQTYLTFVPRGRVDLMEGVLQTKTEAFRVGYWEKASSIYLYERGTFKPIQDMD